MKIPEPSGLPGDIVNARNYRAKPAQWEYGQVLDASYKIDRIGGGRWTYSIWIERPEKVDRYGRRSGGGYRIYVSGEDMV
jgi:hypothetical protein